MSRSCCTAIVLINQSCISKVVQVIKSLQDPLEVGNNFPGISDNVRERGLEQKCFLNADGRLTETGHECLEAVVGPLFVCDR